MANAAIHLAICKKYLERSQDTHDYMEVMKGTLYPDAVADKNVSHYGNLEKRGKDLTTHLAGKVELSEFLKEHSRLDDFELGWFIHLVTDYLFFDECFSKEYLTTHTFLEFRKDLYHAYDCLNAYLSEKYSITSEDYTSYLDTLYFEGCEYEECLFSKEMIDSFIERVSSIDFKEYAKEIMLAGKNIKP